MFVLELETSEFSEMLLRFFFLALLSFELNRKCLLQRAAAGSRDDAVDTPKVSVFT